MNVRTPDNKRPHAAAIVMQATAAVPRLRGDIQTFDAALAERYWANEPIETLVADRAAFFDELIVALWHDMLTPDNRERCALFALGGYGRAELMPGSDIDLLILTPRRHRHTEDIEAFVRTLWDVGLEVGHAVRHPKECRRAASDDLTIATALLERRLLTGAKALSEELDRALNNRLWPPQRFFRAKSNEQHDRHKHYDNTDYGLEPNVKNSPGGLRDIQTGLWICLRQFGSSEPDRLVEMGVLTELERDWLVDGRRHLWWVRFGLHLIAGRKEDRLQFEYQRELAHRLGFVDTDAKSGVERFMYHYYRHVLELREVNDILLQVFEETVQPVKGRDDVEPVNERFQIRNSYIEAQPDLFAHMPSAMLEIFVIMAQRRDINGVRADTIRQIRANVHRIDESFRCDPTNTNLFLSLLKAPYTLVSQLTRMRRYGILGRYIPEFGEVVGQMQHDLFHIYTVDAHTMMVIRHMRRFFYRASEERFPVASHCVRRLPKIELLYIAGLFHDIGKGRGGDHSRLGAQDAQSFCRRHGLNEADTELVSWLVEAHLVMSSTAQRQDIYDPDVVHNFAASVKSEMRLNYLYALTVADINATNPTLWNSWRATLLHQLYNETRKTLRRGLESPIDRDIAVRTSREAAFERLDEQGFSAERWNTLTALLGDDFFLRHSPAHVARTAVVIADHDPITAGPLVLVNNLHRSGNHEGATEVNIFTMDRPNLFAATVLALDALDLSIHDASIHTGPDGMCFNTFTVLNAGTTMGVISDAERRNAIASAVSERLADDEAGRPQNRRISRQLKQLRIPTDVDIDTEPGGDHSVLTIVAADRPGLLARLGEAFQDLSLSVISAKIATLGERVEDVFWIQALDSEGQAGPVRSEERAYDIRHTLRQRLDAEIAKSS